MKEWEAGYTVLYCVCLERGVERRRKIGGVKDGRVISDEFVGEGISMAKDGTKETQGETGSVSVHTVHCTHLLRRSPVGRPTRRIRVNWLEVRERRTEGA